MLVYFIYYRMVEKTPNHDLNIYQTGDENWTHSPDMETVEERLWVRDIASNRHDYTAHEDSIYLATDTGAVYLGNGQDWDQLGTISSSDSSNNDGSTGHGWIDVAADYGADPTGSNDSSQAIQDAIDAAAPNGTVFIPEGNYHLTVIHNEACLRLDSQHSGVTVTGVGHGTKLLPADGMCFRIGDDEGAPTTDVTISDIWLSGENGGDRGIWQEPDSHADTRRNSLYRLWTSDHSLTGVDFVHPESYLDGLYTWDNSGDGLTSRRFRGSGQTDQSPLAWKCASNIIALDNGTVTGDQANGINISKQSLVLTNFVSARNTWGAKISDNAISHTITNGYLLNNTEDGFRTTSSGQTTFRMDNVTAEENGGHGFEFRHGSSWQIGSIYARNNDGDGVTFRDTDTHCIAQSVISERNSTNLSLYGGATADLMHYMDPEEDISASHGNLWMLRGDWAGSEY